MRGLSPDEKMLLGHMAASPSNVVEPPPAALPRERFLPVAVALERRGFVRRCPEVSDECFDITADGRLARRVCT